ncbi:protein of unknown function [Burkholderia multivorans]
MTGQGGSRLAHAGPTGPGERASTEDETDAPGVTLSLEAKVVGIGRSCIRLRFAASGERRQLGDQFVEFEAVRAIVVEQLAHDFFERHAPDAVAQTAAREVRGT